MRVESSVGPSAATLFTANLFLGKVEIMHEVRFRCCEQSESEEMYG